MCRMSSHSSRIPPVGCSSWERTRKPWARSGICQSLRRSRGGSTLALASEAAGVPAKPLAVPGLLLRVLGLTNPDLRESVEMLYEFNEPLLFDGSKYTRAFGGTPTSHQEAMRRTVAWYRKPGVPAATKQASEEMKG